MKNSMPTIKLTMLILLILAVGYQIHAMDKDKFATPTETAQESDNTTIDSSLDTHDNQSHELIKESNDNSSTNQWKNPALLAGGVAVAGGLAYQNKEKIAQAGRWLQNQTYEAMYGPDQGLLLAARTGNLAAVKAILNRGINVNFQGEFRMTALMKASKCGHQEIVQYLLEHKANPNIQAQDGMTALMEAASWGEIETAKLLAKNSRTNLNLRTQSEYTALLLAIAHKNIDTAKDLITLGAEYTQADQNWVENRLLPGDENKILREELRNARQNAIY